MEGCNWVRRNVFYDSVSRLDKNCTTFTSACNRRTTRNSSVHIAVESVKQQDYCFIQKIEPYLVGSFQRLPKSYCGDENFNIRVSSRLKRQLFSYWIVYSVDYYLKWFTALLLIVFTTTIYTFSPAVTSCLCSLEHINKSILWHASINWMFPVVLNGQKYSMYCTPAHQVGSDFRWMSLNLTHIFGITGCKNDIVVLDVGTLTDKIYNAVYLPSVRWKICGWELFELLWGSEFTTSVLHTFRKQWRSVHTL